MTQFFLINRTQLNVRSLLPGAVIDDAQEDVAAIRAAGGRLYVSSNTVIAEAAAIAQQLSLRGQHANAAGIMLAAAAKADVVQTRSGHVRVTNPPAADLVSIKAAADVANGAITIAAQPVVPCKLQVRIVDANSSITAGTLALVGVGPSGEAVTQSIPLTGGTQTVITERAYATLTSGTVSGLAGAAVGDTLGIGVSAHLGLPAMASPPPSNFAVYKANADDVAEAVGTVDSEAGTISPTTAPDGAHDYDFWFTYDIEAIS